MILRNYIIKGGMDIFYGKDEVAVSLESENENGKYVLIDVKGMFNRKEAENKGFLYWRL